MAETAAEGVEGFGGFHYHPVALRQTGGDGDPEVVPAAQAHRTLRDAAVRVQGSYGGLVDAAVEGLLGDDQHIALFAEDDVGNGAQAGLQFHSRRGFQSDADFVGYDALLIVGGVGDFGNGAGDDFIGEGVEHHFGGSANGQGKDIDFVDDAVHFNDTGIHYFEDLGVGFDGVAEFGFDFHNDAGDGGAEGGGFQFVEGVLEFDLGGGYCGGFEGDLERVGKFRGFEVSQVLLCLVEGGLGQADLFLFQGDFGGFGGFEQVILEFSQVGDGLVESGGGQGDLGFFEGQFDRVSGVVLKFG